MDLQGKKALIFGGAGLVGQAICRKLAEADVKTIVICSLFEAEVTEFIEEMKKEFPEIEYAGEWGNIFVRESLNRKSWGELLNNDENRSIVMGDLLNPLNRDILAESTIFKILEKHKPDVLIDSINTASIVAYQNIFGISKEAAGAVQNAGDHKELIEKLLCTQYMPQLIRHVQISLQSMAEHKTRFFLKIGTCGTGGMGLNIPYTHSEDRPSQMLLSKAAIAGAHSLLLFLMGRTPNGPIIKELKPAAAIAWKKVDFGPIKKKGQPIMMETMSMDNVISLEGVLRKQPSDPVTYIEENGQPKTLSAPYIDTGENGLFSAGEFETLTEEGQMEFITPEEIAQCAVWEIQGLNTGHDIVAALDNSVLGPTYRAGYMRRGAVTELKKLVKKTGVDSVAFEILGPPRLSKLLYEAYLLRECFGTFEAVMNESSENISKVLEKKISESEELRSRIISIGVPILMNGDKLIRGSRVAIPADIPGKPDAAFEITPEHIDKWAHDGWVDLRPANISKWITRFKTVKATVEDIREDDTSSSCAKGKYYWQDDEGNYPISFSKLASWIFINEDKGIRMKW